MKSAELWPYIHIGDRVHGWIYSLANRLVMDLDVTISGPEENERLR